MSKKRWLKLEEALQQIGFEPPREDRRDNKDDTYDEHIIKEREKLYEDLI